jgi:hypothetical protein
MRYGKLGRQKAKHNGDPELIRLAQKLNQSANLFYRLVDADAPAVVLQDNLLKLADNLSKIDKTICLVKEEDRDNHRPH